MINHLMKLNKFKVSKGAKIRNRYNQVPYLTQDTNGKVTNSQLDTTNESQEVSFFSSKWPKAHINRCAQRYSKRKTEKTHKRSTKKYRLRTVSKYLTGGLKPVLTAPTSSLIQMWIKTHRYAAFQLQPHLLFNKINCTILQICVYISLNEHQSC